MLLRPSADVRLKDLTRHMAEFFNSLLEPVKKLQSAALLLDFWLGQGVRAAAIPAAVLPMLCIALRAAFGRLSPFARLSRPSNAGQAKKTRNPVGESRKGRLVALPARLQPAAGMRPRVRLAIRPFLLSCGAF
jgi:hypothetical protein